MPTPALIPNTFHIPCRAKHFVHFASPEALLHTLRAHRGERRLVVGQGSNLLFTCEEREGLVLHNAMQAVRMEPAGKGEVRLVADGGMAWDELVRWTLERGVYGLENLSLIPGEVGASAVQNIGAFGAEVCEFIESVECVDMERLAVRTLAGAECRYAYRHSLFKEEPGRWAVVRVAYRLPTVFTPRLSYAALASELSARGLEGSKLTAAQVRLAVMDIRRQRLPDPSTLGNAGSFFKNPVVPPTLAQNLALRHEGMPQYPAPEGVKLSAAWLIDQCGWKGRSMGEAAVHEGQPLVLVNRGGATGKDILSLCRAIQHDVRKHFGVTLHPEVNIIGKAT